jgi:hypothetical protein
MVVDVVPHGGKLPVELVNLGGGQRRGFSQ